MEFVRPRPNFPKKAVVTGGMPYGNKLLHFGHVGMAVRADIFARFLRDRIGKENVVFVSGTDCYGSPAVEAFRKLQQAGQYKDKTIRDFIQINHDKQYETFKNFEVSFNLYGASALGRSGEIHNEVSDWFVKALNNANMVSKHGSLQFFDKKNNCLLNGRQVVGKCPIQGCQSEKGYADECDLGHQYLPQDLIDPVSTLSGETPELVKVENLYFNLENCLPELKEWIASIERNPDTAPFMVKEIKEFFKDPEIYIKREYFEKLKEIKAQLPPHTEPEINEKAPSTTLIFAHLSDREKACEILAKNNIHYRTGKCMTPFRLTGDIAWGVPCPEIQGIEGQTFYVWPESLWAPISFTKTYLESIGKDKDEWKKYWCSKEAQVYQFLGEDNIYFYGPAQQMMFLSTQGKGWKFDAPEGSLQITKICPIKSILYMNQKASSSGAVKPPMADEFLKYYTAEQFRLHLMAMNLTNNNVGLSPKAFNPDAKAEDADPMVTEGNLLTNVYNRILRTMFYTLQNNFDAIIPTAEIDESTMEICRKAILDVETFMYNKKFNQVFNTIDVFIRNINKYWVKEFNSADTKEKLAHLVANTMQFIAVADVLIHPVAPSGAERVADMIGLDKDKAFNWNNIFDKFYSWLDSSKQGKIVPIKEKEDFFKRHEWQLEQMYGNANK